MVSRRTVTPAVQQPADVLNLFPGNGSRSVVRWTAPAAGTVALSGRFQGLSTDNTTSDGAVSYTHNGSTSALMSQNVTGPIGANSNTAGVLLSQAVSSGDYLDFSVGYGGNGNHSDSTGLAANVTLFLAKTYTFTYDYEDRPIATSGTGVSTTYIIDGNGHRVSKTSSGTQTKYVFDGDTVVSEVTGGATTYHLPGVGFVASGAQSYYQENALGSTLDVRTNAGALSSRNEYDGYGMTYTQVAGPQSEFRFAGSHGYITDDDTSLQLLGHRYYVPQIGRFLTADPIGQKDDLNLYGYCKDDPISSTDPTGNASIIEVPETGWGRLFRPYEHAFIQFEWGVTCITKLGTTASIGFWPGENFVAGQGRFIQDEAQAASGTNSAGNGYKNKSAGYAISTDNRPEFDAALKRCIQADVANGAPDYTIIPPIYVCGSWAHDMWDEAEWSVSNPGKPLSDWRGETKWTYDDASGGMSGFNTRKFTACQ